MEKTKNTCNKNQQDYYFIQDFNKKIEKMLLFWMIKTM
jgi:hypothetical protein